jgi:hypothetical protein
MVLLATLLTSALSAAGVIAGPLFGAQPKDALKARQGGGFATQSWENDYADVNYTDGGAGAFSLSWDDGFAGNFVIGKGYRQSSGM